MKLFAFILLFFSLNSYSVTCPTDRSDYFCLPSDKILNSEINISNFYLIPVKIMGLFTKEIAVLNYPLELKADWNSPYFGAGVSLYENSYRLMILGGTTRMQEMTLDGYAAIVCHEMGHLLAGEPRQTITGADWASAEGQADFFAASNCLKKYFRSIGIASEQEISKRVEKAGFDFLNLAMKIESNPKNKTLKRARVEMPAVDHTLLNVYPSLQCRYENFRNQTTRPTCWYKN